MDRASLLKIVLVAVVVSLIAWFYATEGYEKVDPEGMRVWIRNAGLWGGVLFIVAYSCLQPVGVNGLFFLLSAPLIWLSAFAYRYSWLVISRSFSIGRQSKAPRLKISTYANGILPPLEVNSFHIASQKLLMYQPCPHSEDRIWYAFRLHPTMSTVT